MKIKEGANIQGIHLRMRPVLIMANQIWNDLNQELVVTCGLDGTHSAGSYHYYGLALDLRTNYFTDDEKVQAVANLKKALGNDYDVIAHSTHAHVEYDPTWGL